MRFRYSGIFYHCLLSDGGCQVLAGLLSTFAANVGALAPQHVANAWWTPMTGELFYLILFASVALLGKVSQVKLFN